MSHQRSGSADGDNDDVMEEWQAARDVLAQYDGYLHDIRKYGFSFVTGLLTVDALLGAAEPEFKLAALVGTMALIVILFVIDRNYRVFLAAANLRATLLERRSPPELSQAITRVYETQRVGSAFTFVYFGLVSVTWVIGYLVLGSAFIWELSLALCVAFMSMYGLHLTLGIRPWVYFDIDGFEYEKGETAMVVVSYLRGKESKVSILSGGISGGEPPDLELKACERVWDVYDEEDISLRDPKPLSSEWSDGGKNPRMPKEHILISERHDHRWEFPTASLAPGLYRAVYEGPWFRRARLRYELRQFNRGDAEDLRHRWDEAPRFRVISTKVANHAEEKKNASEPSVAAASGNK